MNRIFTLSFVDSENVSHAIRLQAYRKGDVENDLIPWLSCFGCSDLEVKEDSPIEEPGIEI